MGSEFELIANTTEALLHNAVQEIQRIETLLTEFNDTSITAQINTNAGVYPVKVPPEVFQLIQRCQHLSKITQGAFDISSGALKQLWKFKERGFHWPAASQIATALANTGYQHIQLQDEQVFLSKQGMAIGFGAIGKGYAADKAKALLQAQGVSSGVINASGDLSTWGPEPWKVGIANPDNSREMLFWLPVKNAAVATSGNYEQYVEKDGIRYSHNIDPRKGLPVPYIKSVTVISPSAELSDALATAVTVMGTKAGMDLVNQLPDVHCILIDEDNKIYRSANIKMN
ncbi:FAD:protein FMN transferase [Chitinophaga silvisoli]|uniref:FAD:protein FMN transferase n=2 Tax=Chitinophaga silvisoli TaxID=2291814 RepID=A0A3E1PAC3_9BACT|nr:FAD:protein FMN transferase [Chitinophaga silvisoli]